MRKYKVFFFCVYCVVNNNFFRSLICQRGKNCRVCDVDLVYPKVHWVLKEKEIFFLY